MFKWSTGQSLEAEKAEAMEYGQQGMKMLGFVKEVIGHGGDLIEAVLTGDVDKLAKMSEPIRMFLYAMVEVYVELFKSWSNVDSYEKGYLMGRATFDAASMFFPWSKVGVVGKVATKSKFLDALATQGKGFFGPGGRGRQLVDSIGEGFRAALRTSKMCFVAGTLVVTADGWVPIEQIREGDLVWSRHETSLDWGYRQVVATFVTHPRDLFDLEVDLDGDGETDETLSGTGEHPFYVSEPTRSGFVPLSELRLQDELVLKDGRAAWVVRVTSRRGPPGAFFTTYNFEVEDFHTYFVGESGVWVHNHSIGQSPCDEVFSAFYALTDGASAAFHKQPWSAFDDVARTMGKGRNSSIFGWAADEVMRKQLKELPLAERAAQWPSHSQVKATMSRVWGKMNDVELKGAEFGSIDVPPWVVKDRIDLGSVKSLTLESHHGIPKKLQDWLGLGKAHDDCPAYLTTMLEHRGADVGIHQRLAKKLGGKMNPPVDLVPLNRPRPTGLTDEMILNAMEETYRDAGLEHFWDVCKVWMNTP